MQQANPDPGHVANSGMERRLDHEGPARANASNHPTTAGTASREAVTLTGGGEACHHHQPSGSGSGSVNSHPAAPAAAVSSAPVAGIQASHTDGSANPSSTAGAPITTTVAAAESYEQQHVHSVYETIASHFSSTRYKPWPFVASFLSSLPPGSVGLDVGCGNGKYLDVNPDLVIFGSDRSANLARLARDLKVLGKSEGDGKEKVSVATGVDVVGVADGLDLPFGGSRRVDFAICIAVIHHLSTRERRIEGVRALLDCITPRTGKVLVYVWALEQGSSRRGWDEGTADQDQLVPWVLKSNKPKKAKKDGASKKGGGAGERVDNGEPGPVEATYQRYYHLYRKGELEEDVEAAGGEILGSGYEKDNWWVIASPKEGKGTSSSSILSR
ncbi:S-adenosyl-L-methionine-dependent methyltransferase [Annulohypoxylon maeteangense]|uniref:S-adenosyl-L-methionine-dependent methyltransferase n=1 Tax=Annulohypoxylon maeteangense TaxID=1927788 RepID=UPI002008623D|nr:S-adenosyl-L-methionine-dependent methyltransferase [Annulohypoxylon maeteangense]KAI0882495.1 S-adenosyl-L-methionine-dependent methyltransferase [Annulohypoxylon maeteangense]